MKGLAAVLLMSILLSIFTVWVIVLVTTTLANTDVQVRRYLQSNSAYVQPYYNSNAKSNLYEDLVGP